MTHRPSHVVSLVQLWKVYRIERLPFLQHIGRNVWFVCDSCCLDHMVEWSVVKGGCLKGNGIDTSSSALTCLYHHHLCLNSCFPDRS